MPKQFNGIRLPAAQLLQFVVVIVAESKLDSSECVSERTECGDCRAGQPGGDTIQHLVH